MIQEEQCTDGDEARLKETLTDKVRLGRSEAKKKGEWQMSGSMNELAQLKRKDNGVACEYEATHGLTAIKMFAVYV